MNKKWLWIGVGALIVIAGIYFGQGGGSNSVSGTTKPGQEDKVSKQSLSFGEQALKDEDTIWYILNNKKVDNPTRETRIQAIYVTRNGNVTAYDVWNDKERLRMSDVQELSDQDVIKKAKELDKMTFELSKENVVSDMKSQERDEGGNMIDSIKKAEAVKYKEPAPQSINIKGVDTGTDKTIVEEIFVVEFGTLSHLDGKLRTDTGKKVFAVENAYTGTIDGQNYSGNSSDFVMKTAQKVPFVMDDYENKLITEHKVSSN